MKKSFCKSKHILLRYETWPLTWTYTSIIITSISSTETLICVFVCRGNISPPSYCSDLSLSSCFHSAGWVLLRFSDQVVVNMNTLMWSDVSAVRPTVTSSFAFSRFRTQQTLLFGLNRLDGCLQAGESLWGQTVLRAGLTCWFLLPITIKKCFCLNRPTGDPCRSHQVELQDNLKAWSDEDESVSGAHSKTWSQSQTEFSCFWMFWEKYYWSSSKIFIENVKSFQVQMFFFFPAVWEEMWCDVWCHNWLSFNLSDTTGRLNRWQLGENQ